MIKITFTKPVETLRSTKELYQWDKSQSLEIGGLGDCGTPDIHFTFHGMKFAYVVKSESVGGKLYVEIPNKILMYGKDVIAYICTEVNGVKSTLASVVIPVIKRNMPADYFYNAEDDELATVDRLLAETERATEVETNHEQRISNIETNHGKRITDLESYKSSNTQQLKTITTENERQHNELQSQISVTESNVESLSTDYESFKQNTNSSLTSEIATREILSTQVGTMSTSLDDITAEVVQARVNADGAVKSTLKQRLDSEIDGIKEDLDDLTSAFDLNLFNKDSTDNVQGQYIVHDGEVITYTDNRLCYSHLISVKPNSKYTFKRFDNFYGTISQYAFGYKNGVFVSDVIGTKSMINGATVSTITIPSNVNQIRINFIANQDTMFVKGENYPTSILPFGVIVPNDNLTILHSEQSESNLKRIQAMEYVYDKVITSWSDITDTKGGYIKQDGTRVGSSYLKISPYIRVNPSDIITASGMNLNIGGETIYGIACYDINKNFISGEGLYGSASNVSGSFTVPANCYWVAISDDNNSKAKFNIKAYSNITPKVSEMAMEMETLPKKYLKDMKIVNFGDSIFGQARPPYDISTYLEKETGATVYNCGFGGCRMGVHSSPIYDAFSMYRLAYSIANNSWTLQDTALEDTSLPSYFSETIALLKSIDWSDIDICTIGYGTNDFGDGLCPYKASETSDERFRFVNLSLKYSIETLLNAYPNLRIFIITPHYRFWLSNGSFVDDSNTHEVTSWVNSKNYKLTDFVEAIKNVAKEYQLPVIDDYYDLGLNQFNRSVYYPSNDGTHQNVAGRKLIAKHIAHNLF